MWNYALWLDIAELWSNRVQVSQATKFFTWATYINSFLRKLERAGDLEVHRQEPWSTLQ